MIRLLRDQSGNGLIMMTSFMGVMMIVVLNQLEAQKNELVANRSVELVSALDQIERDVRSTISVFPSIARSIAIDPGNQVIFNDCANPLPNPTYFKLYSMFAPTGGNPERLYAGTDSNAPGEHAGFDLKLVPCNLFIGDSRCLIQSLVQVVNRVTIPATAPYTNGCTLSLDYIVRASGPFPAFAGVSIQFPWLKERRFRTSPYREVTVDYGAGANPQYLAR